MSMLKYMIKRALTLRGLRKARIKHLCTFLLIIHSALFGYSSESFNKIIEIHSKMLR